MAPPTVRSAAVASNTGGSLTVAKPTGLTSGDLLIAWQLADNDGALSAMGAPSGFTQLGSEAGVSGGHPYEIVWTKTATAADASGGGFTFTNTASGIFNSVAILAITAGSFSSSTPPTSAVSFQNGGTSSSTSHVAPSVTGVVDGLLLTSHGTDSGGVAATYTPPAGMTEWADTNPGAGSYTALEVNALALTAAGATGSKTATCSTSRPWKGSALVVNPAAGGGSSGGGTRVNLSPNPALKNDATGWTGPSAAPWARGTGLHATLPRTTGYTGSTSGDVFTPRAAVTAGQQYRWAISIYSYVDQTVNLLVNFYNSLTGSLSTSFVAASGSSQPFSLTAGSTTRLTVGPFTVPATAVASLLKLIGFSGQAEVTAYQVEDTATFGPYFDGDSTGASWDGTAGNSTSTLRSASSQSGSDPVAVADSFSIAVTASGPTFADAVGVSASFTVAAGTPSSGVVDSVRVRDGFLISSLEWDPTKGRNRVSAFTFDFNVITAQVTRRRVRGGAWELVRGGMVDVFNGQMRRPVDDYEFPSGEDIDYRIDGLDSTGRILQSATVRRASVADQVWLKFITQPALNQRLDYMGRGEIARKSRTSVYDVQGRSDPVVVSDVHSSRQVTIKCKAETPDIAAALDHALSQGLPCYLQVPAEINTPSMYAVIGDYQYDAPALKSQRNVFSIPLTEVAPPPATVVSPGMTWLDLLDTYPTWEALMAAVPTWLDIAD